MEKIQSDEICAQQALLASIFLEGMGLTKNAADLSDASTFFKLRLQFGVSGAVSLIHNKSASRCSVEHTVNPSLTLSLPTSRLTGETFGDGGPDMQRHEWLVSVLKDIVVYSALNDLPQVARHVASSLEALHLRRDELDRKCGVAQQMLELPTSIKEAVSKPDNPRIDCVPSSEPFNGKHLAGSTKRRKAPPLARPQIGFPL